jgi:uncharacterized protein
MRMAFDGVSNTLAPATATGRVALMDALRGFALAGVLLVNLGGFSLYYFMDPAARALLPTAGFDAWAALAVQILAQDKGLTLFSLLFGAGLAMQVQRADTTGDGIRPIMRRSAVLLAIGALHAHLFWWGDILMIYALLSFVVLPFRHVSDRALLAGGIGLGLFWFLLAPIADRLKPVDFPGQAETYANAIAVFSSGSLTEVVRTNIAFAHWSWREMWSLFPFVFARFLLGYWIGRKGLLQAVDTHRVLLRNLLLVCGVVGLTATVVIEWIEAADMTTTLLQGGRAAEWGLRLLRRVGSLGMGFAYLAGFALLFTRPQWQRGLRVLAPAGRMALTLYLMQTCLCVWLFYGVGLGIGPAYGFVTRLLVWALLFAAQIAFSHWWLQRFRLGPVEWVWRSLADGRPLPIRR